MTSPVDTLLSNPKQNWLTACQCLEQQGSAYCIATIVAESGSLPRGVGSKIVISASGQFDTLGGGSLEHKVIHQAREGLKSRQSSDDKPSVHIERFALAADLGQCCGGAAQVMFEYVNTQIANVVIFGAGHVCHALAPILQALPCHLQVIDSRSDWLNSLEKQGVSTRLYEEPAQAIAELPDDSHIVIMTHEHSQDYEITKAALMRECFPYIGLIASTSKKQRFEYRLKEVLPSPSLLEQLTCPIGHPSIKGKLPMQVAVSISAQLMTVFDSAEVGNTTNKTGHKAQWEKANNLRKHLLSEK